MTPTYRVRVWRDDAWWLARVMAASDDADTAPLNAITQARSPAKVEAMGRDLIATILDADDSTFGTEFEYVLPGDAGGLISQARDARSWLDAAHDLWHERAAKAAKALTSQGYSLRETAAMLGLSHQRIDQIVDTEPEPSNLVVFAGQGPAEDAGLRPDVTFPAGVEIFVVIRNGAWAGEADLDPHLRERIRELIPDIAARFSRRPDDQLGHATA